MLRHNVTRRILFYIFLIFNLTFATMGAAQILDDQGYVRPEVTKVFQLLEIWIKEQNQKKQEHKIPSGVLERVFKKEKFSPSLEDLNTIAQNVFLRPPGIERVDLKKSKSANSLDVFKDVLFKAFQAIGDTDPILPSHQTYKYILLNGSTVKNMRERLATLVGYVESGKLKLGEGTQLIFLTGKRDLFKDKEGHEWEKKSLFTLPSTMVLNPHWKQTFKVPETEDEAARWIWNQTKLPEELRQITPIFVVAGKKQNDKGEWVRPSTFDTVNKWLESHPQAGLCLSISSQPFVFYQQATIEACFKKAGLVGFTMEGVGDSSNSEDKETLRGLNILLDNLARTIYTVLEARKQEEICNALGDQRKAA